MGGPQNLPLLASQVNSFLSTQFLIDCKPQVEMSPGFLIDTVS